MTTKPRQPRRKPVAKRVADPPAGSATETPEESQPVDTTELPQGVQSKTVDGRPACYLVDECGLPEFMDDAGLCGRHWALRPDVRKVARRG